MRTVLFTILAMLAFAANSVLTRLALADGAIGPAAFAAIRLASGTLALGLLLARRRGTEAPAPVPWAGAAALAAYMVGFSFAYVSLGAGAGALILFGAVQVTMFAGALARGEAVPQARWIGALVAFGGLAVLLWPAGAAFPDPIGAGLMVTAAVGWGVYSLLGARTTDPLRATTLNFVRALPVGLVLAMLVPDPRGTTLWGAGLAIFSGAVTSGLGYALWYRVLPHLPATVAAMAQLTVPVLALVGGIAFIGEAPTLRFLVASLIVIGGVGLGVGWPQRRIGSSGS